MVNRLFPVCAIIFASLITIRLNCSPVTLTTDCDFYNFNDADFQNYDQDTYEENQPYELTNTDDQISFAMTTLVLDYKKKYLNTELFLSARFQGLWGNDTLGENGNNAFFFFDNIYTSIYFYKNTYLRVGRQNYSIGGASRDYFFNQIIDGAVLDHSSKIYIVPYGLSLMGDITSIASRPEDTNKFSNLRQDANNFDDYDGNTLSFRLGGTLTIGFLRGFGYYQKYGANAEGGADISNNGLNSANKQDGDDLIVAGGRLFYDFKRFGIIDITYAESIGHDYQYETNNRYQDNAFAANYEVDIIKLFGFPEWLFKRVIPSYSFGNFSDGFCGMKGDSFGDQLLDDYLGYSVSPYAGAYHFYDYDKSTETQTYSDKTVSKKFNNFSLSLLFGIGIEIDFSYLDLRANDSSEKEIKMGNLYSTTLGYVMNNIAMHASYSMYQPDKYYEIKAADNPFIREGNDPFYAFSFSFSSNFVLLQ